MGHVVTAPDDAMKARAEAAAEKIGLAMAEWAGVPQNGAIHRHAAIVALDIILVALIEQRVADGILGALGRTDP